MPPLIVRAVKRAHKPAINSNELAVCTNQNKHVGSSHDVVSVQVIVVAVKGRE